MTYSDVKFYKKWTSNNIISALVREFIKQLLTTEKVKNASPGKELESNSLNLEGIILG